MFAISVQAVVCPLLIWTKKTKLKGIDTKLKSSLQKCSNSEDSICKLQA
jgi:hypothetical protein